MRVTLTPSFIANAKCQSGAERSIYWANDLPGFGLQVTSAGSRSFVVQYRHQGRSRRMAISATLKLSEARKQARSLLGVVAKDRDPLAEKRKKEALATNTLQSVCENYFKRESGNGLRSLGDRQRTLARLVYPKLGSRQIDDIRRSEIMALLDKIDDESGPVMSDRTLAYLRRIFLWHAKRTDGFNTPIVKGMARTRPTERARKRILNDDELRAVWKAAGTTGNAFGPLVRFILTTATRRNEAAHMRRSEIDGDVWIIPARRSKSKRDQAVPLSGMAQDILAGLPVIGDGEIVFSHDGRRSIGGFGKFKSRLDAASGVTGWTLHDLRRTARSLMSRGGVDSDIAERVLGHVIGGVRGVYDRYEYLNEKRRAVEALAGQIRAILGANH